MRKRAILRQDAKSITFIEQCVTGGQDVVMPIREIGSPIVRGVPRRTLISLAVQYAFRMLSAQDKPQ